MTKGLIIAAPASGSGKTTITLGILRALQRSGVPVRGAKSGPDYIDPRFHEAASGHPALNLDAWAMTDEQITKRASGDGLLIIEGAMGLFDGAPPGGKGATADLARSLGLPVVLVVDAARMAQSIAPIVQGFALHDPKVKIVGVILNKVGSPRHEKMLRRALEQTGLPVLGTLPRVSGLTHPSRHLGLVQASERPDLETFLDHAADQVLEAVDLHSLQACATDLPAAPQLPLGKPPAQTIAIARDAAFAFSYPHMLADWHAAGATLSFFSPLADEAPSPADFIFLPGGYPELHAAQLAAAHKFRAGMSRAAETATIYGECGGYMTLGKALTDADGVAHEMLGLLPLETSFEQRALHLGYRHLTPLRGPFATPMAAHEFHYATTIKADGPALFEATDAEGIRLEPMGLRRGRICGSFAHIIDWVD